MNGANRANLESSCSFQVFAITSPRRGKTSGRLLYRGLSSNLLEGAALQAAEAAEPSVWSLMFRPWEVEVGCRCRCVKARG